MLTVFAVIMAVVCVIGFFNEKVTRLPHEIALLLFSAVLGFIWLIADVLISGASAAKVLAGVHMLDIESFLLEGVLCLMLFSVSYDIVAPILMGHIVDLIAGDFAMSYLLRMVLIYASILVLSLLCSYVQAIILQKTGQRIISTIRNIFSITI